MVYRPLQQIDYQRGLVLVVLTQSDPETLVTPIRNALDASAPGIDARNMQDITEAVNVGLSRERFAAMLATLFGLMALGLAAMGLYGVMAFYVTRRTTEIGIGVSSTPSGQYHAYWSLVLARPLPPTPPGAAASIGPFGPAPFGLFRSD